MKIKLRNRWTTYLPLLLLTLGIPAGYAIVTFTFHQTAPPISTGPPALSGCDPLSATPASIPTGSQGGILFTCGTGSNLGALTVNSPVTANLSYGNTPPNGYDAIYIILHNTQCSLTTTSNMQIFGTGSQTTISFTATSTTQYDYCGIVTNTPPTGLSTWTITWTWTP